MTVQEAKEDIVNILDRQTIKRVRRECERLAAEKDLPAFKAFLDEGTHFILTDKRADILQGVYDGLATQESPGVILHGAYGSGKTVMMENIAALCQADQSFGGREFNQLHYGDTPVDCITISLEQNDTPTDFLHAIFEALVTQSDNVAREDLKAIFNDRKINLTIEDLDNTLPPSQRDDLIDRFEDPDSLEDIARVTKSLTAGDAHKPITWFTTYYLDREGRYPALYIDEFEQLFRQGVDPGGTYRLKAIIQKMIRNAVSGFDDLDTPPYILFANTLSLDELKDRFSAERDLIDRITESVSYNIDLSEDETKELFAKLYRLYVIPLLADRDGDTQDWYDTLTATDLGDDGYVYPFTDDALNFALSIVQKFEDETQGETVVRAFRDYKRILIAFLDHWEDDGRINLDFLYQHGDDVREQLRGQVERVNLDELPGEGSIKTTIETDYNDATGIERRVLCQIAKVGILQREERPVYFTADEIISIADTIELQIDTSEAADLIARAASGPDYFAQEDDRLEFNPNELTGTAAGGGELSLADQVGEAVDDLDLEDTNLLQLWETMQEQCFPDTSFENRNDQYLVFDTDGDINYTSKVYLSLAPDSLPERLQAEVDDDALQIVIRLGRDTEDELPARFYVTERNGRASNITDEIQESLNQEIEAHVDEDSDYYDLIEAVQDNFSRFDEYQAYVMFLKLSLADLAGEDIHSDISARTAEELSFSIIGTVDGNFTNIAHDYPRTKLGFNDSYAGKNYLNLVYGIKYLEREGELIHNNANHPHIDVRSFGRVSRTREYGDEFRSIVSSFADNESFIQEQDDGKFDLVPEFSSYSAVLDKIESNLDDDGLEFNEILDLIFGTTEVENVAKAMVYLLLILGQYWDDYSWVFEDEDETTIIPANVRVETQREQTRKTIGRAIEIEILNQAKQDEPDSDPVKELKRKYDSVDEADAAQLDDLQEEVDADWEFEYQGVNESLREIGANSVFADTAIATYAATIRPLDSIDAELRYLILDDLNHLVTQVEQAAEVLEKQDELDQLVAKVEWFDIDPDLQSENLCITCISAIEEFWKSRQVERNIDDADIAADLDGYLAGDIQLNRLFDMLQRSRKSIVPQVDTYDADDHLEDFTTDLDYVRGELEDTIGDEQDKVADAREELKEFRDRIPGESSWLRHGDTALDNCESELNSSPEYFDHEQYGEYWDQWETARRNLEQEAFSENEFEDTVRKYDSDIDIEVVEDAAEDGINAKFTELDNDAFGQVIAGLDSDSETAEELKQSLLKIRVKAELMGNES